ncbi:MAG: hypothetical protein LLG04_02995 [Parachlamydia sp.]|nr:hypothetical protein [Parachlamydia sp.]
MLSLEELQNLCMDKLKDAQILYKEGRFGGAYYVCGYVIELRLKKQISLTIGWEGYPGNRKEFENLSSFKKHDLDLLLHLSGVEKQVKRDLNMQWYTVSRWKPEIRYSWRCQTEQTAKKMLIASEEILEKL